MLRAVVHSVAEFGIARTMIRIRNRIVREAKITRGRWLSGPVTTTAYGVKMLSNWQDRTFALGSIGDYGTGLSDLLRSQQRPFVFLDIGANQGIYTLIAAELDQCRHVFAFEPVPHTAEMLERNVSLNKATGKVTLLPVGISDVDAEVSISLTDGHSGVATLRRNAEKFTSSTTVQVRTLDRFADSILAFGLPIVVKVDVEGHEEVVLAQLAASRLAQHLEAVFYEFDERWSQPEVLRGSLEAIGFRSFDQIGPKGHHDVLASR